MRVRGSSLLCLSVAAHSQAFLIAPPASSRGSLGDACRSPARASAAPPLMAYDVKYSPNRWRDEGDIVPGFGGVWPGDPDAETHHVRQEHQRAQPLSLSCCAAGLVAISLLAEMGLGCRENSARRRESLARSCATGLGAPEREHDNASPV